LYCRRERSPPWCRRSPVLDLPWMG
jgi:hypothetical protein